MTVTSFSVFSSIFGFIAAAISLFAFLVNVCRSHLPGHRIKELEILMDETEAVFYKAIEDGFLIEPGFVQETEHHLEILRALTCCLRSRAYSATTLCQEYRELFHGTSQSIGTTCYSLKKLRAQVVISSEEGRRRLTEVPSAPAPRAPLPDAEDIPVAVLSSQIPRACSCPPVLPGWTDGYRIVAE